MTYTPTLKSTNRKVHIPENTIQFEMAWWLLTKTSIPQKSRIGDLAFMWAGF